MSSFFFSTSSHSFTSLDDIGNTQHDWADDFYFIFFFARSWQIASDELELASFHRKNIEKFRDHRKIFSWFSRTREKLIIAITWFHFPKHTFKPTQPVWRCCEFIDFLVEQTSLRLWSTFLSLLLSFHLYTIDCLKKNLTEFDTIPDIRIRNFFQFNSIAIPCMAEIETSISYNL